MAKPDIVALGEPMYEFSQVPGNPRQYLRGYGGDTMNCAIAATVTTTGHGAVAPLPTAAAVLKFLSATSRSK